MISYSFSRTCHSLESTYALASCMASLLNTGDVIALEGELGAGKTNFVQGLAQGLHIQASYQVASPTFVYHQTYEGKKKLHHMDWYRIEDRAKLIQLDLLQYLEDDAVCVIEWFSKHQQVWLFDLFTVKLQHVQHSSSTSRCIEFLARGERPVEVLRMLERQI